MSMEKYVPYIGSHEKILGSTVYVKIGNSFYKGTAATFIFPRQGIIGKYTVKCDDGRTRTVKTIYKEA